MAILSNVAFVLMLFALGVRFAYSLGLARGLDFADRWKTAAKHHWTEHRRLRDGIAGVVDRIEETK